MLNITTHIYIEIYNNAKKEESSMDRMNNKINIAVLGAAGKAGQRITTKLLKGDYNILLCEKGEEGKAKITEKGLKVFDAEEGIKQADVTIMAVPDEHMEEISNALVPLAKPDSIIIALDAGAPYAGEFKIRNDCTFVATHPCHPSIFRYEETPEAQADVYGGVVGKQDIVIALISGKEEKFELAKKISIEMYSPVVNCFRITVEEMALMEPLATEVVALSAVYIIREAMNEAIRFGVPEVAARSFMFGHLNAILDVIFTGNIITSDASKIALEYGIEKIYKSDWKDVMNPASLKDLLAKMLHPLKKSTII